ncbi:MAG: hypothetical protein ACREL7_03385 [Longimicrobiales bacterium]
MESLDATLRVESGQVSVIRLYDVAHEIDLARVEREAAAGPGSTRIRLTRAKEKAVTFAQPPVEFGLGRALVALETGPVELDVTVRVHDFGAISLTMTSRVTSLTWSDFVTLANAVDDGVSAADVWSSHVERVRTLIASAIVHASPASQSPSRETSPGSVLQEDYLVATVQRFDRPLSGEDVLARLDLVPLLAGEAQPLSEPARRELLRHAYTYYRDDLVVISYARALIVEPGGDTDVADVLEVANAQLLELRYYDERLDAELPRMYERVEQARQRFGGLARPRYANLARSLHTLVAEVTEVAERIDNALVVTEDVYLARVYAATLEQFRVRAWSAAVDRKLAIIRDTYTALYDEAATTRAEYLEIAIVLLIVFDIVLAFIV